MTFIQRLRYYFNLSPRAGWTRAKVYGYTINGWDLVGADNTVVARIVLVDGFWEVIDFTIPNAFLCFADYVEAMIYCEIQIHRLECEHVLRSNQPWYGASIVEQILANNQPPQDDWLEFVKKL